MTSNQLSTVTAPDPNVIVGIKPLPVTAAMVKSDQVLVQNLISLGYNSVLLSITNSRYKEKCKNYFKTFKQNFNDKLISINSLKVPIPTISEINLINGPHCSKIIGLLSAWIELDNENILINEFSFQVLVNELSFAQFLGIKNFLIAPPKNLNNLQIFSNNLNKILNKFPLINISISLPISEDFINYETGESTPIIDSLSTWDMWNSIRIQCNYNKNLSVSLGSPKSNIPESIVERWLIEPIRYYLISSSRFILNNKNYPVLNKFNQLIIWKIIQKNSLNPPIIILHGVDKDSSDVSVSNSDSIVSIDGIKVNLGDLSYLSYINYLIKVSPQNNLLSNLDSFTLKNLLNSNLKLNQWDPVILQNPLDPLNNNLDNYTYKVFEQDIFKYDQYERAILSALIDISKKIDLASNNKFHILILGPGRGPLIERLLSAINFLKLDLNNFEITAIEKNPTVMIYLQQRNKFYWSSKINILNLNAKNFKPDSSTHIPFGLVISELLGSFGCNELAPECIDCITEFCSPDCIFIPKTLHCFIAPVFAPRLWKISKIISNENENKNTDNCYIPLLNEIEILCENPIEVWSFNFGESLKTVNGIGHENANDNPNLHNKRQSKVTAKNKHKGTIHALSGFFRSVLYNDIEISNITARNSKFNNINEKSVVSWLPFFMPLDKPIRLFDKQEINIFIKRDSDEDFVWYEWSIECFIYMLVPKASNFGNNKVTNKSIDETDSEAKDSDINNRNHCTEEYKVRVCTDISKVHNVDGNSFKLKLVTK